MLRHQKKIMELYNFEKWNFEIYHVVISKIQPLFEEMEDSIIFSVNQLYFIVAGNLRFYLNGHWARHWVRWWMKLYLKPANKAESNGK